MQTQSTKKSFSSKLGEKFTVQHSSQETAGCFVEIDIEVAPNAQRRPLHYHPAQTEYFQILEGTLKIQVGNEVKTLQKGEEITLMPGTSHRYWNDSSETVKVKTQLSPALNFETFLTTIIALEKTVPTDMQGVPTNKLVAAQFINRFNNIMIPSDLPKFLIQFVMPILGFFGSILGYKLPKTATLIFLLGMLSTALFAQSRFSTHEFSINGFRNPSIGLEYRFKQVSVHGGLYNTNMKPNETTQFMKFGTTFWFLPVGKKQNPSSFYLQLSYMRGLNRAYENKNAFSPDFGFRWMVWKGLNLRVGLVAVYGEGNKPSYLWTPGISYSFFSKK
jgi:quercetin dioxygenase-like cupin family protein